MRTSGKATWVRSPGGLVSALLPIVTKARGAWIGWAGTAGPAPDPFDADGIVNIPIPVSAGEVRDSYHGACNSMLWPLYHDSIRQPEYHRHWWTKYVDVNERFASTTVDVADRDAIIWVHDYQLQLVPALIRQRRSDARIGFFLHTPFPPEKLFGRLPWRSQILDGLLGADVVGFQTKTDAQNFVRAAHKFADVTASGGTLTSRGRSVRVDAFPISIDFDKYESMAKDTKVLSRSAELQRKLGRGRKIVLGVDRLDYTKGIDQRLKAFSELLSSGRKTIRDCVFIQVAVPSRERIAEYRELQRTVDGLVGQINGEFGEVGVGVVHYLRRNLPVEELVAMYHAAEVMLVTPLVDGMNLVAKEYVATRTDNTGVLVLSEFAGAAPELRTALTVNPHDVDGLADAMNWALSISREEMVRRMKKMRQVVRRNTVHHWAAAFLQVLGGNS